MLWRRSTALSCSGAKATPVSHIASADARRLAAEARLNAEQLSMATEFAQMLFMVREADRMAAYLDGTALPNLARALASAQAAYQSGMGGFGPLAEMRLMQLAMQLERADARREREAWKAAVHKDPLLPRVLLPAEYLGRRSWEARKQLFSRLALDFRQ